MLGVTTYITTDLAAVPLLWAVPLALYLLTFVLAFASPPLVPRSPLVAVLPLLLSALILLFVLQVLQPLWLLLPLHLLGFAMTALVIHGELAKSRPHPAYLTEFYFWIALGGVLGGLLNAIAAPILFPKLLEYPLVLLLSLLLFQSKRFSGTVWGSLQLRWTLPLGIGLLLGGLLIGISGEAWVQNLPGLAIALLLTTLLYRTLQLHPALLIVGWLLMVLLSQFSAGTGTGLLASDRSFFGVYRVFSSARDGGYHSLLHGTTLHGKQSLDPARRQEPLTYFTRSGPVGQLFSSLGGDRLQRVSVLGLGVGTLAAYAEAGQEWTFYEIDPLAEELATDPLYFTYLQESAAAVQIVIGDGRLAIAQTPNENYDLLFMDAFSSDSIPIHLITQEAIQLYFTKLQPQGILAINITNRFLDLEPVLGAIAQSLDLATLTQWETEVSDLERSQGKAPSHWVLLAHTPEAFGALTDNPRWQPATTNPSIQPWTDDFSNILQAIAP